VAHLDALAYAADTDQWSGDADLAKYTGTGEPAFTLDYAGMDRRVDRSAMVQRAATHDLFGGRDWQLSQHAVQT